METCDPDHSPMATLLTGDYGVYSLINGSSYRSLFNLLKEMRMSGKPKMKMSRWAV
jgi:hypothetical protein